MMDRPEKACHARDRADELMRLPRTVILVPSRAEQFTSDKLIVRLLVPDRVSSLKVDSTISETLKITLELPAMVTLVHETL